MCVPKFDEEERIRLTNKPSVLLILLVQLEQRIRFNSPFKPSVDEHLECMPKKESIDLYTTENRSANTEINKSHSILVTASLVSPLPHSLRHF